MASKFAGKRGLRQGLVRLGLVTAALLIGAAGAPAQPGAAPPPKAAEVLRGGIAAYERGDFETAARHFAKAQVLLDELSDTDAGDLSAFSMKTGLALKARQDGGAHLRLAEDALRQNRPAEASKYLKAANANQYLSPADRQVLAALNARLASAAPVGKVDPRSLLTAARTALQQGDPDLAETLATQAEKAGASASSWLQPWADSPAKVRRDIQTARKTGSAPIVVKGPAEIPQPQPSGGEKQTAKYLPATHTPDLPMVPTPPLPPSAVPMPVVQAQGTEPKPAPMVPAPIDLKPLPPPMNESPFAVKQPEAPTSIPSPYVSQTPVPMNDPPIVVQQPEAPPSNIPSPYAPPKPAPVTVKEPSSPSPYSPFKESVSAGPPINPAVNPLPPAVQPVGVPPQVSGLPPVNPVPAKPAFDERAVARQLLMQGYKALDAGDFDTARKLAFQVQSMRVELDRTELGPDQLLSEIQKRASVQPKTPAAAAAKPNATPADSRAIVREARAQLAKGQLEETEKLLSQAAAIPNARWGLFEDSPEKVRRDLVKARAQRDRDDSIKLLAEARKLYDQGNYHEAKVKAFQAQNKHGPYSVFDFGDRPGKLIDDIARVESQKKPGMPQPGPGDPAVAQHKAPTPQIAPINNPPLVSAAAQSAMKNRALVLMREARDLAKRDQLVEALARATEAQKLKAPFGPGEESPDSVILFLTSKCRENLNARLMQVHEALATSATDPARFQKAAMSLDMARKLAQAYGLDTQPIDQKAMWVQQLAQGANVNPSGAVAGGPNPLVQAQHQVVTDADKAHQAGQELLDKARLELKAGKYDIARRFAQDAFNPSFGVQREAEAVLRTIDADEHGQRLLAVNRSFEAGMEAFLRKDYPQAGGIFQNVEFELLSAVQQQRLREIMATTEMQPRPIAQVAGTKVPLQGTADKPGTAQATDQNPDDPLAQVKVMELIQFQQFQDKNKTVQRNAIAQFKAGQELEAMKTLDTYLGQVVEARFDPERTRQLSAPAEKRKQEFRTLMAQKLLASERKLANVPMKWDERNYEKKIQQAQEQVAELIKQSNMFRKEGKYKEGLACAQKAHDLDPDNSAATAAIFQLEIMSRERVLDKMKKENAEMFLSELDNKNGPMPTDDNPFQVSEGGINRLKNRKAESNIWMRTSNPIEREIEYKLDQPVPGLQFSNTPLSQVITVLKGMYGFNIHADKLALDKHSINLDQPISGEVEKIKLKYALDVLLRPAGLTYMVKGESLWITTAEEARGKMKQVVYSIADLIVPVENHPLPDVYDMQKMLERHVAAQTWMLNGIPQTASPVLGQQGLNWGQPVSSYNTGLGGRSTFAANAPTTSPMGGQPAAPRAPGQTMEDLLQDLIKNTVAPHTWKDMGGPGIIQYYPLGMALVINQTVEVQGDVQDLLAALRKLQDMEIAIEMRVVSVSESFYERIGVDFDVNLKTPSTRYEGQLLGSNFAPFGQVNRNLSFNNAVFGLTPAGTLTPDLNVPIQNSSFGFSVPPFGGYTAPGLDGGLSLGLAFLSDVQVFMMLEAAQADTRTNIMQAPRITVFNGQTAFIQVGVTQFINTGISAIPFNGQVVFQPTIFPLPANVALTVTPVVSADRRFVRINLSPRITNFRDFNVITVSQQFQPIQSQVQVGPGAIPVGQQQLFQTFNITTPAVSTINLTTTVNVPDGGTVLLGGLKVMSEGRNEAGPPILSKIPYISRLFRNVGWGRDAQSFMILVTPRIIINEEEENIFMGREAPIPRP